MSRVECTQMCRGMGGCTSLWHRDHEYEEYGIIHTNERLLWYIHMFWCYIERYN